MQCSASAAVSAERRCCVRAFEFEFELGAHARSARMVAPHCCHPAAATYLLHAQAECLMLFYCCAASRSAARITVGTLVLRRLLAWTDRVVKDNSECSARLITIADCNTQPHACLPCTLLLRHSLPLSKLAGESSTVLPAGHPSLL